VFQRGRRIGWQCTGSISNPAARAKVRGKSMINDKVVPLERLQQRAKDLRAAGKKIVATNGCFDLLHVGHVRYLNAARALGGALIVGINGDQSVRELKGAGRPINNENDRAEIVAALACVDLVTIFPEMRATRFLELAAPDVYVKGGDYNQDTLNADEREVLQKVGAKIDIVPLERGFSTSDLVKRLSKLGK
jgi:rfaE bifunctional protein nucleotidyltransferase chain/domain